MSKRFYTTLPDGYAVCEHVDCPVASTCLHQIAYGILLEKEKYLRLINPGLCTKDGACTFYRDCKPVTYARGFTNFQRRMYPAQYQHFMTALIGKFGRNPYFERRRGATPLPPAEQHIVLNALKDAGVNEDMRFDKYEEHINWYD